MFTPDQQSTAFATNVSETLFYTGCDNPFQGPLGRPILGASNHCFISVCFANFVDYLITGVRKTRETLKRHLFY